MKDLSAGRIETVDTDSAVEIGRASGGEVGDIAVDEDALRGRARRTRSDRRRRVACRLVRREELPHEGTIRGSQAIRRVRRLIRRGSFHCGNVGGESTRPPAVKVPE